MTKQKMNKFKTIFIIITTLILFTLGTAKRGDPCQNLPARISPEYYSSLLSAYEAAEYGDTIESQAVTFTEDLNVNKDISVTINSGYDCDYNDPPPGKTVLNGNAIISNGSFTIEKGSFHITQGEVFRIMPVGDSITRGGGYPIGALNYPTYRYYLYNMISNAGLLVDYVGPYNGVGADFNTSTMNPYIVPPLYRDTRHPIFPDQDLAGSTGWKIDRYLSGAMSAKTLVEYYDPDIVLVHLGTNDLGTRSDTPAEAADEIGQLIDLIRAGSLDAIIFVAQIIPLMDNAYGMGPGEYQAVQDFNALLPGIISQKNQAAGYPPVTLVDMWIGFDPETMLAEQTHPNDTGDKEMAMRWYNAIID
jgi:hypothetical protein